MFFQWAQGGTYCGEGGALWFDCSLVITTAAQRPGWIFPWSCVVHSILLHGRWSRMKDVQHVGETKLNCFWHCYQSFRICLCVRINLMKLYCDAMKVSTLVPAGKKRFQLRIHVPCLIKPDMHHTWLRIMPCLCDVCLLWCLFLSGLLLSLASVLFRSCEDLFVYDRLSSSWIRSSSLRDLRQDDHTLEITTIFAMLVCSLFCYAIATMPTICLSASQLPC